MSLISGLIPQPVPGGRFSLFKLGSKERTTRNEHGPWRAACPCAYEEFNRSIIACASHLLPRRSRRACCGDLVHRESQDDQMPTWFGWTNSLNCHGGGRRVLMRKKKPGLPWQVTTNKGRRSTTGAHWQHPWGFLRCSEVDESLFVVLLLPCRWHRPQMLIDDNEYCVSRDGPYPLCDRFGSGALQISQTSQTRTALGRQFSPRRN